MADLPFELKAKHIEGSRRGELLLDSDELNNLNQVFHIQTLCHFTYIHTLSSCQHDSPLVFDYQRRVEVCRGA